jgi:hypothetical protein
LWRCPCAGACGGGPYPRFLLDVGRSGTLSHETSRSIVPTRTTADKDRSLHFIANPSYLLTNEQPVQMVYIKIEYRPDEGHINRLLRQKIVARRQITCCQRSEKLPDADNLRLNRRPECPFGFDAFAGATTEMPEYFGSLIYLCWSSTLI